MVGPQFVGLSTGRAGSRYLAAQLNKAGIKTVHEQHHDIRQWALPQALGEVSAWIVRQVALDGEWPEAKVWHFSRHPQPFVTSLIRFGFWKMNVPEIHDHLRRTGDILADSYRYWVDWNRTILQVPNDRRTTFRIEDISPQQIEKLAQTIGRTVDASKLQCGWVEGQDFSPIPESVRREVRAMMAILGYEENIGA